MRFHELQREQRISRRLDLVFPFFERPENLALITPPWLGFEMLCTPPVEMVEGRLIDYRIRLGGIPIRWRSIISTYEPPHCFVDEQVIGPYSHWHHAHLFESEGDETRIMDKVRYALPDWVAGPLERGIHRGFVRPALEEIFDYRASMYEGMFGSSGDVAELGGKNR